MATRCSPVLVVSLPRVNRYGPTPCLVDACVGCRHMHQVSLPIVLIIRRATRHNLIIKLITRMGCVDHETNLLRPNSYMCMYVYIYVCMYVCDGCIGWCGVQPTRLQLQTWCTRVLINTADRWNRLLQRKSQKTEQTPRQKEIRTRGEAI
jgi:hypothetical protein